MHIEASRAELLGLLASLGIEYPSYTKLSDATLERRLLRALDCAQSLNTTVPSLPLDPTTLARWKTPSERPLFHVVRRNNLSGSFFPAQFSSDHGAQTFRDLCDGLMELAKYFDDGFRLVLAMDEEGKSAICLKNIEILKIDDDTPLFVVMYSCKTSREAVKNWEQLQSSLMADFHVPRIKASRAQQQLLVRILSQNSQRIAASYKSTCNAGTEFNISFLLPVGPLRAEDLGALHRDPGCAVCGKKTTSRCSRCVVVLYCGKGCQMEDWTSHKTLCKSLAGGTWKTVQFSYPPYRFASTVNRHSHVRDITAMSTDPTPLDLSKPPPNKHGSKPFIIKLQNNSAAGPQHATSGEGMMTLIYDRQRTLQVYSTRSVDKEGFDALLPVVAKGWLGMKVFCWARRVSDWELSICLDRLPDQDIKW